MYIRILFYSFVRGNQRSLFSIQCKQCIDNSHFLYVNIPQQLSHCESSNSAEPRVSIDANTNLFALIDFIEHSTICPWLILIGRGLFLLVMSLLFISRPLEYCGYSEGRGILFSWPWLWGECTPVHRAMEYSWDLRPLVLWCQWYELLFLLLKLALKGVYWGEVE